MNTPRSILLCTAVSALIIFSSCRRDTQWVTGTGSSVTETRSISGFSALELNMPADVRWVQDSGYRVEISAQSNVLHVVESSVNGRTLTFQWRPFTVVRRHLPVKITIHSPALNHARVNGSGTIQLGHIRDAGALELYINGSGSIRADEVNAPSLICGISGSGNISLQQGACGSGDYRISGSGSVWAADVITRHSEADISGSGHIELQAEETLHADISGSGDVRYKGKPVVIQRISGSGKVRQW